MSKYRAVRTTVDGIAFASKKEARRYGELKLLQRAKKIFDLTCQEPFALTLNGVNLGKYVADFTYNEDTLDAVGTYTHVVEDVKGFKTPVYRLKKKLMRAIHGIEIRET